MIATKLKAILTTDEFTKRDCKRLFFAGALFGALLFVAIYGVAILNPTYIGWIFCGDNDLKQHYAGWCHYRMSPWHFPIGLIDTLSYPTSISVIYTDSIPILAVLCKLFSSVLPVDFQYFGIAGLLSFMLSGGTATILLRRFIKESWICVLMSSLFVVNYPIMQRMFYHTALSAHWLIFIASILWLYDKYPVNSNKTALYWSMLGAVAVSIHPYFVPMLGMILLADRICAFVFNKKKIWTAIFPIISYCVASAAVLWILGGFYGDSSSVGFGLGTFNANFNTFINPMDYGVLLPNLGVENYFQYEGCAYLGMGILVLFVLVVVMVVINRKSLDRTGVNRVYHRTMVGLFLVSFAAATLPKISIGTLNVGTIPYPEPLFKIASIFRSNGRFIWPAMYLLMMAMIVHAYRFFEEKPKALIAIFSVVILLQGIDLSKQISEKHEYYYSHHDISTMWDDNVELSMISTGKKHFVFLYDENDWNMDTAFYAYKKGMTLNNFYFARDIDKNIKNTIDAYFDEIDKKMIRDDTVYIMKKDQYMASKDFYDSLNARFECYEDHIIMVAGK